MRERLRPILQGAQLLALELFRQFRVVPPDQIAEVLGLDWIGHLLKRVDQEAVQAIWGLAARAGVEASARAVVVVVQEQQEASVA